MKTNQSTSLSRALVLGAIRGEKSPAFLRTRLMSKLFNCPRLCFPHVSNGADQTHLTAWSG